MQENPLGVMGRAFAIVVVPTVLNYYRNMNDGRYEELEDTTKRRFWVFPWRTMDKLQYDKLRREDPAYLAKWAEENPIYKIPKPQMFGDLAGTFVEDLLDYMRGKDPERFRKDITEFVTEITMPGFPTFLSPLIDIKSNRNPFMERPIVPTALANLPIDESEKYTSSTSPVIVEITRAFNKLVPQTERTGPISPMKVEYLLRSWTGGLGRQLVNVVDMALEWQGMLKGKDSGARPAGSLADTWLARAFVARNPSASVQPIQDFWTLYERSQLAHSTTSYLENNDPERAPERLVEDLPAFAAFDVLDTARGSLTAMTAALKVIQSNKTATAEAKKAAMDQLTFRMIAIADQAVKDAEALMKVVEDKQNRK
jgi:hypothetical protein